MALEIGAAYISIIPSTKGMIRDIKRSLNKDGGKAATEAGRDMGRNMSKAIADELSEVDPFDHMRTSVSKSRSEVNEFSKAMSKASKEVVDANNKARVAQARYGEALSRSNTKASTLLNLQLAAKKATDDLTNSQARLSAAEQSRGAQISDLIRRERELAHATSLRSQAEKLAAMTRQTMVDRLRSQFAGRGSGLNLQVELDPGAPVKLGAELERVRNELRNRYKIELDLDVDRNAISHVGNAVRRAFNSERMTSFRSGLAGVSEGFAQMRTKIMHLVPGTWVILGTLGAIAAMTFAPLIASMTQVIGLLAAIPALATAAAGVRYPDRLGLCQLRAAAADRRSGCGLPAFERVRLLGHHRWCRGHAPGIYHPGRRGRLRLDHVHAAGRRRAHPVRLREPLGRRRRRNRCGHHRIRREHAHHRADHARAGHDHVPTVAVRVDDPGHLDPRADDLPAADRCGYGRAV